MNRVSSAIFVLAAATTLACEAVSRNVGSLQSGDGEPVDLVEVATDLCEAEQTCCIPPNRPQSGPSVENCLPNQYVWLLNASEHAAEHGRFADPVCFDRLSACEEPEIGCEPPCKLFIGTKGLGEPCEEPQGMDDCAQGLVCQIYSVGRTACDGPVGICEQEATRCVDPCASEIAIECRASDTPSRCGPDAYCDDVYLDDDYLDDDFGTCRPRPTIGESCADPGAICVAGSFCDHSAPAGPTCAAMLGEGAPCNDDWQCLSSRCGGPDVLEDAWAFCEPPMWEWCTEGG